VVDLNSAIKSYWWDARLVEARQRRAWIASLYPAGMEIDWKVSTAIFALPAVVGGYFVHAVPPPVLKWVARARAGALATSLRKATTGLGPSPSPLCPCCGAASEDDAHVVAGCPATGAGACVDVALRLWLQIAAKRGIQAPPLATSWVSALLLQLSVALIPTSARGLLGGCADSLVVSMLRDFHRGLAERLAEVLRCREELLAQASSSSGANACSDLDLDLDLYCVLSGWSCGTAVGGGGVACCGAVGLFFYYCFRSHAYCLCVPSSAYATQHSCSVSCAEVECSQLPSSVDQTASIFTSRGARTR